MIRLDPLKRSLAASAMLGLIWCHTSLAAEGFELTTTQRARLERFLPHTLPKLSKKEPVHALVVGDSVMSMHVHTDDESDTLKSYPGVFLNRLADQFYYTGGLRVVRPGKGRPEKALRAYGPELTVRNTSRGGRLMIHTMNVLAASAWDEKPDLVLVSFGINDAIAGHSLATYRRAVQDAIDAARSHQADILLLGATPTPTEPAEQGLALTRPYVDTMREVADANGVFFADLGDISWLVRVDEPMKDLEKPAPKKPKEGEATGEEAAAQREAPAPADIINFPKSEELDPDPEKRAARLFNQVAASLRRWFDHGGTVDLIHPNTTLHRLLGRRVFAELLDGPRQVPWSIGTATAEFKDAALCEVSCRAENRTEAPLRINLLPLVTDNWKPKEAESQMELKPGRKGLIKITYVRNGAFHDATPPHEAWLRLPVMVLGGGMARIENLRATLQPFTMLWNLGAQFNQEGGVTLSGRITNTTENPLAGTWEASCLGQKFNGSFNAPARADAAVTLHLKLPDNTSATRQRGILAFTAKTGNLALSFPRSVELVQNIGLKQTVTLPGKGQYETDKPATPPVPGPAQPGVTFRADADPDAIYFTWDIHAINLADAPGGGALSATLNLDARSYGKRLLPGVTDSLRITASSADGPATINALPAWAFGNGYNLNFDRKSGQAALSSRPDGSRRLTLMLPRNLFTLHEWALGNGNSQLGLAANIAIWQRPDERNPQGSDAGFIQVENGLHRDDAEALAVLELTPQPTQRWTVHFY